MPEGTVDDTQQPAPFAGLRVLELGQYVAVPYCAELLARGFAVTHETIRIWESRFAPLLADRLREKRRGRRNVSWYLDETYVKVAGPAALPLSRH